MGVLIGKMTGNAKTSQGDRVRGPVPIDPVMTDDPIMGRVLMRARLRLVYCGVRRIAPAAGKVTDYGVVGGDDSGEEVRE